MPAPPFLLALGLDVGIVERDALAVEDVDSHPCGRFLLGSTEQRAVVGGFARLPAKASTWIGGASLTAPSQRASR